MASRRSWVRIPSAPPKILECGGLAAAFSRVAAPRVVEYRGGKQQPCSSAVKISATRLLVTMFSSAPKKLSAV